MKWKWFAGVVIIVLLSTFVVRHVGYMREPESEVMDEVAVLVATQEIREVLNAYTEAMKNRDVDGLADLMSYPFDMGSGYQLSTRTGFVSKLSHDFRKYVVDISELSHEILNIDVHPEEALVEVRERSKHVGDRGERIVNEAVVTISFRKEGDVWKISGTDSDSWYSLTFRRRDQSGRTLGW